MVVGPQDSGKSSVSRILGAYAARLDRNPIFIDLDVSQGFNVPGNITAIPIDKSSLSIEVNYFFIFNKEQYCYILKK